MRARSSAPAENAPLVVAEEVKSALRLAAVNDAAARLGLKPGMALADARAMYPAIAVAEADPEADRDLLDAIADWCDRYTPLVGLDPPDGLMFDITGCAHLFGGEAALGRDLVRRLAAQGFHARVAVADTVGCAWAVARYALLNCIASGQVPSPLRGGTGGISDSESRDALRRAVLCKQPRILIIPPPNTAAPSAPARRAAHRADTVAALAQVGLKRIADVIDRPRAPLAARFGEDFVRRLDQALGRDDEPITPRLPVPPYVTERRFAEPIALEADVLATIEHLAQELGRMLERRGEGARGLQAALFRTDGKVHRIVVGDRRAVARRRTHPRAVRRAARRDRRRLRSRLRLRRDPALRVRERALRSGADRPCRARSRRGTCPPDRSSRRALRPAPHHPAGAAGHAYSGIRGDGGGGACGIARSAPYSGRRAARDLAAASSRIPSHRSARSACSSSRSGSRRRRKCPDGPPKQFTWRHVAYHVVHAEGPERIAMEWWRDDARPRADARLFSGREQEGCACLALPRRFFNDDAARLVPARHVRMACPRPFA